MRAIGGSIPHMGEIALILKLLQLFAQFYLLCVILLHYVRTHQEVCDAKYTLYFVFVFVAIGRIIPFQWINITFASEM